VIAIDVTDRAACRKAVHETVREFGGLNILVNNAAFQVHAPGLEAISEMHFDETLKTNLYGYYFMAQAALEHMKEGDAIINTGSISCRAASG
jgi:NAD(P)-dependent dehydrogenase (short-subunit alcohol dehydrogenase family)